MNIENNRDVGRDTFANPLAFYTGAQIETCLAST